MHSLPLPIAAFVAGLLSFLSPCVLPLVPGYVSLISGASVDDLQSSDRRVLGTVMLHSFTFILGFSFVFIVLGAVATGLGRGFSTSITIYWPALPASSSSSSDCI